MSKVYIKGLKGLIINSIEESVQYVVTKAAFERCAEELAVAMNMAPGALTGGEWPSWHALLGQVRENLAAIQDLRAERELRAEGARKPLMLVCYVNSEDIAKPTFSEHGLEVRAYERPGPGREPLFRWAPPGNYDTDYEGVVR